MLPCSVAIPADILTLVEDHPEAKNAVPDLKARLERLRTVVLTIP